MLVTFAAGPGQSFVFTVFLDPIIQDTGHSRTTVSGIYAAGTIVSALAVLIVSRLSDRKGPRAMLIIVAIAFGLACFGLSLSSGIIALAIFLALLRGLGQGAMPINSTLLVSQWFIRNRGRAMAILGLGGAVTVAVMPNLSQWLIDAFTWRGAYIALGLMIWAIVLPLGIFVVRNQPEDMGLFPDGERSLPKDEVRRQKLANSRPQERVLTSFKFWSLALPMAFPALVDTALVFHQVALFARQGLSAEAAARVFIPFAIASAISGLLTGFIIDRTGPRVIFIANMAVFFVAVLVLQVISTPATAVIYGALLGSAMGMQQINIRYTWPYYYGRYGLGNVQGSAMMVLITATAIGPVVFAAISESVSYNAAFAAMIVALVIATILRIVYSPQPA
jgi:MFS family permease